MQANQKIQARNIKQYLREKPHLEQLADGKLAYILGEKQSVSGMFNNDRFMFLNGKDLTFGYSNDLPLAIPIGSFLKIRNIKKQAHLEDVLIQRSKHKLKAIEVSVQKYWYKDREEKIPEVWVFILSSTKAADDTVNLFNTLKAEVLAKQIIPPPKLVQTIFTIPSQAKGDQEVNNSISIFASENLRIVQPSPKKKTEIKITPEPVIDISIKNKPKQGPSLSINPAYNVISRPKHIMYSQGHSRYQLEKLSLPAYYNETVVYPPSYHPYPHDSQQVIIVPYSPKQVSHHSIQYPITHHGDSPRMPNSIIVNSPERKITKYELQIKPQPVAGSASYTRYSHPNNSVMSNIPIVIEVSQKQSNSQNQKVSDHGISMNHHSNTPHSIIGSYPSNGIVMNFQSSRKHNIETVVKEPISPISKRQRTKSRYAIDNSEFNSNSGSPNSKRFSNQKQKLINVWDEDSPQLIDFTLKSSPVKNRISPSKFNESPQNQDNDMKSNKRRRTQYVVLKDCKDWNQEFYFSLDPLDTIVKFKEFSAQVTMEIINSFGSLDKKYHILKQTESQIVYEHLNLIITLGFNPNFDKQHNKYLEKSVQNYIYVNEIVQNKQFCRVPLVNLIKYKGIFALVKASLGNSTKVNKNSLVNQIKRLESLTKIPREQFNRCSFKLVTYFNRGSSTQIIFIDDLEQLIPSSEKNFRKQLIIMAAKQKGLIQSSYLSKLLQKQIDNFLFNLQNLQFSTLSSEDLYTELHKYGIFKQQLGILYNKASTEFVKQIFTSELLSQTASDLFSVHLQNQIKNLTRKKQKHSDRYLVQAAYEFMDDLCSATNNSEALWDVITSDTEVKYKIRIERKYLMWGYFLSAFLCKGGLKFNINSLDKSTGFSEEYNCINAHSLEGFECIMVGTQLDYIESISTTRSILFQLPSEFGYQKLRSYLQNPSYFNYIKSTPKYFKELLVYFSNFIPCDANVKNIINPYESIPYEPSSLTSIRLNLSKMKWLLKHKDQESAVSLLELSCEHIGFWGAEIHPLMSEFYDLLASYYVGIGQSQEALTLAKSSLVNIVKLVGSNSLAAADKFYFLANVMYNIGKYQQSFGNFSKAREVLLQKSINNTILGKIQLKISILYHHFNKLIDSQLAAKQALEIFIQNKQQRYLIQTYELLDKLYRTQNKISLMKQNALDCSSKLESSRNQQVYSRTIKLSLNPFIAQVSPEKKKILLETIQMLNINLSKKEYYNWLFKKSNVVDTVINYLRGIDDMAKDMTVGNIQKYKGVNSKTDNHLFIFLSYLEAILGVTELTAITGILRSYE